MAMPIFDAVVLGVVQGLTEFLPVSSTAHLILARRMLKHENAGDAFTVIIQLGTLVAVFLYFRRDIATLLAAVWGDVRARKLASTPQSRLAWLIAVSTIPAVVAGVLLKTWLRNNFGSIEGIAVVAIVFALLMALAEVWTAVRRPDLPPNAEGVPVSPYGQTPESIAVWQALLIGCWQALALMPGASRSGTTITGGLFAGLTRPVATRFSFLLSLPVILGAGLKETYDEYKKFLHPEEGQPLSLFNSSDDVVALAVGLVVSAVVGYASIAWLLRYLSRFTLYGFVTYRLALGAGILLAYFVQKM